MIDWLLNWWWRRQRRLDMEILWPEIVARSTDLEHAHLAFMVHALGSHAWVCRYENGLWRKIITFTAESGKADA